MKRATLRISLAVALAASAVPALAGDVAVGVGVSVSDGSGEQQIQQVPAAAGKADLVAVVKVTEITEPKAEADKKEKGEAQPQPVMLFGVTPPTQKVVAAEVTELLRGDKELKAVKFRVAVMKQGNREMMVINRTVENAGPNIKFQQSYQQWVPFALAKDKPALIFLKKGAESKGPDGKAAEPEWEVCGPLFAENVDKAVAAAREAIKKFAEWDNPPKLAAEDEAAARKLIAELGSDDFAVREAATKALSAKGAAVKPLLEEALKTSKDPEIKERAARVLEAIKPAALRSDAAGVDPSTGVMMIGPGAVQIQMQAGGQ